MFDRQRAAAYIYQDKGNSIRLLYPNLDFNYSYNSDCVAMLTANFDNPIFN